MRTTAQLEREQGSGGGPAHPEPHVSRPVAPQFGAAFVPNATAFIASGCIMVVEILSGRLVSPFLGSSLYTWTSAIGVVLAGISIGNYVGGRLADRFHVRRTLSALFLLASIGCMLIPAVNAWIGGWKALQSLNWPMRIFMHFLVAFLPPSTMLGMIGPVVAKMALDMGRATGRTIGTIYAWGAIGSIVGTFMAGFLLIALMGTNATIFTVAGVLALMALFYGYRSWAPYAWAGTYGVALVFAAGPWSATRALAESLHLRRHYDDDIVFARESQYQLVRVRTALGDRDQRLMLLDKLVHSKTNLKDPLDLMYEYEMVYGEVLRHCHPDDRPMTALAIGGGGFVLPRYLEVRYPGSHVEVAEIDPVVTEAAHAAFGLPRDTAIHIYNMDARNHVADLVRRRRAGEAVPSFDFIFGDSISDFSVPYHLTTREFNQQLAELLSDRGVYMLNMIDLLEPGRFLGAVLNTCRDVFPHQYVFKTSSVDSDRDTFIVVNAKHPLQLDGVVPAIRTAHSFPGRMLTAADLAALDQRSRGMVLTDNFAPVENLLAAVVRAYAAEKTSPMETFVADVIRLIEAGQLDKAAERCEKALRENPSSAKAHLYRGVILSKRNRFDEAIVSYREALRFDANDPTTHANLGMTLAQKGDLEAALSCYRTVLRIDPTDLTARNQIGLALARLGREQEAVAEYRQAIAMRPGSADAHYNLGALLMRSRAFEGAAAEFAEVLKAHADHLEARRGLAAALLEGGKPKDAIAHLREALRAEPNRANLHDQLGQALAQTNDPTAAAGSFARAVDLEPFNAAFRQDLGMVLQGADRLPEALKEYKESMRLQPRNPPLVNNLARILAASPEERIRDCAEAIRLAEQLMTLVEGEDAEVLDTVAVTYACAGRFDDAVKAARRALALAKAGPAASGDLAKQIEMRLKLYEAGRPYIEAP